MSIEFAKSAESGLPPKLTGDNLNLASIVNDDVLPRQRTSVNQTADALNLGALMRGVGSGMSLTLYRGNETDAATTEYRVGQVVGFATDALIASRLSPIRGMALAAKDLLSPIGSGAKRVLPNARVGDELMSVPLNSVRTILGSEVQALGFGINRTHNLVFNRAVGKDGVIVSLQPNVSVGIPEILARKLVRGQEPTVNLYQILPVTTHQSVFVPRKELLGIAGPPGYNSSLYKVGKYQLYPVK